MLSFRNFLFVSLLPTFSMPENSYIMGAKSFLTADVKATVVEPKGFWTLLRGFSDE